jgi:hypothetical protein
MRGFWSGLTAEKEFQTPASSGTAWVAGRSRGTAVVPSDVSITLIDNNLLNADSRSDRGSRIFAKYDGGTDLRPRLHPLHIRPGVHQTAQQTRLGPRDFFLPR